MALDSNEDKFFSLWIPQAGRVARGRPAYSAAIAPFIQHMYKHTQLRGGGVLQVHAFDSVFMNRSLWIDKQAKGRGGKIQDTSVSFGPSRIKASLHIKLQNSFTIAETQKSKEFKGGCL